MNLYNLPTHEKSPRIVNAVIEIEEGSKNKYEYDGDLGVFMYDRCLNSAMVYPASYGFVPNTLCDDGDPLDIMVISPEPIKRATVVEAKVLGVLDMEDEGAKDYKIIAVPNFYTRKYFNLKDIEDSFLEISKNFFAHYKDLSMSGDRVKVFDWHDKDFAHKIIKESIIK
jgi:inorganic pyrophosphatase|tara:strand:+ start:34126 stop:34632 length:507 start_codon:yes stop_codon:yes gene_type:complete